MNADGALVYFSANKTPTHLSLFLLSLSFHQPPLHILFLSHSIELLITDQKSPKEAMRFIMLQALPPELLIMILQKVSLLEGQP